MQDLSSQSRLQALRAASDARTENWFPSIVASSAICSAFESGWVGVRVVEASGRSYLSEGSEPPRPRCTCSSPATSAEHWSSTVLSEEVTGSHPRNGAGSAHGHSFENSCRGAFRQPPNPRGSVCIDLPRLALQKRSKTLEGPSTP